MVNLQSDFEKVGNVVGEKQTARFRLET